MTDTNLEIPTLSSKKTRMAKSYLVSILLAIMIILQLGIVYLALNPINVFNQLQSVQNINRATKKVSVPLEIPQTGQIGDKKTLGTIEDLKKNAIDGEIYKDAKDGDYVLGYTSKLVIYRPSEDKVIYDGETPAMKLKSSQDNLVNNLNKKALDGKVIKEASIPQVQLVTDADALKKTNEFYKDVAKDDIIATYSTPTGTVIMVYRPSTDVVVKSGTIQLSIK
jgi:hypothetical protein